MNKVILMGRLTKDPEIRYGNDNRPVARYSIAVDRRYKDQNGNYPTDFFNLTSFGKTAEFVERYLRKGTKIVIDGEIRNNNYEKDGKTVYQDQIVANSVEFAESKNAQGGGGDYSNVPTGGNAPTADAGDGFNAIDDATEDNLPFV